MQARGTPPAGAYPPPLQCPVIRAGGPARTGDVYRARECAEGARVSRGIYTHTHTHDATRRARVDKARGHGPAASLLSAVERDAVDGEEESSSSASSLTISL